MNAFTVIGGIFFVVILLVGGGLTAFCIYKITQHRKKIAAIEGTVLSDVADLRPGYCKIVGKVEALSELLVSPLTQSDCVYFEFEVHEQRTRTVSTGGPNGGTRTETYWEKVIGDKQAADVGVKDKTGLAEVDLLDAETVLSASGHSTSGTFNDCPRDLQRTLSRKYGFSTKGLIFNKGLKYKETVIEEGDKLFVIGDVETTKNGMIFVKGDDPFIVSDRNEAKTLSHFKTAITWNIVGAVAACVFTVIFSAIPIIFMMVGNQAPNAKGMPNNANNANNAFAGVQNPPVENDPQAAFGQPVVNQPPPNVRPLPKNRPNVPPVGNPEVPPKINPPFVNPPLKVVPPIKPKEAEHPETPWSVRPDPSPTAAAKPLALAGSIPFASFNASVIFPTSPSPFVILPPVQKPPPGQFPQDGIVQAFDLRTMKAIGPAFSAPIDLGESSVLSPDGAHYAARAKGVPGTINVWSTKGGRPSTIVVDTDPRRFAFPVDFVGKDRLLTMGHDAQFPEGAEEAVYQVWDLTDGKEVAKFKYHLCFHRKWGTISPGGKYLVMEKTHGGHYQILAWETATGKQVADLQFQDKDEKWGQATGLAISADGKELAMIWRLGEKPNNVFARILVWDMATGKKLADHKLGYELQNMDSVWGTGGTQCLQWLPDSSGWLIYSHLLVDRKTGAVTGRVGSEPKVHFEMQPRNFLTKDYITATAKTGFTNSLVIVSVKGK